MAELGESIPRKEEDENSGKLRKEIARLKDENRSIKEQMESDRPSNTIFAAIEEMQLHIFGRVGHSKRSNFTLAATSPRHCTCYSFTCR